MKFSVGLVGGYALLKAGAHAFMPTPMPCVTRDSGRLKHLSPRQERIVTAVALVMAGPSADQTYHAGGWDPAADFDALLDNLADDQRQMVGVGLYLFDEWTWRLGGFCGMVVGDQIAHLEAWRNSGIALQRSIWGLLHAALCSSFSGIEPGWEVMGYPGPCLPRDDYPGRTPGQSVRFDWDEQVP